MTQDSGITGIAHVIQLSVAPVFLLSGIGAMLAVMTNRLARVIDRARALEAKVTADPAGPPPRLRSNRDSVPRRLLRL